KLPGIPTWTSRNRVPVGLLAERLRRVLRCRSQVDSRRTDAERAGGGHRAAEGAGRPADVLLDRPLLRLEQLAAEPGTAPFLETSSVGAPHSSQPTRTASRSRPRRSG